MNLKIGFSKLNSKILLGFLWALIAIVYIVYRYAYHLDMRIIDWVASGAMFIMGILSIIEGVKISKNNTSHNTYEE